MSSSLAVKDYRKLDQDEIVRAGDIYSLRWFDFKKVFYAAAIHRYGQTVAQAENGCRLYYRRLTWVEITDWTGPLLKGDVVLRRGCDEPELASKTFISNGFGYTIDMNYPHTIECQLNGDTLLSVWRRYDLGGKTEKRQLPGNKHYSQVLPLP